MVRITLNGDLIKYGFAIYYLRYSELYLNRSTDFDYIMC